LRKGYGRRRPAADENGYAVLSNREETKYPAAMPEPDFRSGISEFTDDFDAFILDQWGVLHDGQMPFPGVLDCLGNLRAANKKLAILTNSSRRIETNRQVLRRVGFDPDIFDAIVSSGDEVWQCLKDRSDPWYAELGRTCLYLSRAGHEGFFDGLDVDPVESLDRASFLLNAGVDPERQASPELDSLLADAASRNLPMVCANPDLVYPLNGKLVPGPGSLARRYEELGGAVRYHGKPYPSVYESCLEQLGVSNRSRVLGVGDSLRHDVAGANGSGIVSAFVAGGIHGPELGLNGDGELDRPATEALCRELGHVPDLVVPHFVW
jgi:HAD superfamily hydrolase (TIGR01459 family)